jgi:hypothetical protein
MLLILTHSALAEMPSNITLGPADWRQYACDKAPLGRGFIFGFVPNIFIKQPLQQNLWVSLGYPIPFGRVHA